MGETGMLEELEDVELDAVGVLELVDQHVAEAVLVVLAQRVVVAQQFIRAQHQLGKVDHAFPLAPCSADDMDELGLTAQTRVILFAGKLIPQKQPRVLLEAFLALNLPDAALIFVGPILITFGVLALLYVIANVSCGASVVLYNAYLNEICDVVSDAALYLSLLDELPKTEFDARMRHCLAHADERGGAVREHLRSGRGDGASDAQRVLADVPHVRALLERLRQA